MTQWLSVHMTTADVLNKSASADVKLWLHISEEYHLLTSLANLLHRTGNKGGICIFKSFVFVFFLKSSTLQKKVRHRMSPRTVLFVKQSRIFTQRQQCRVDLQYQYIQRQTVQYFWTSSCICVTKEYFRTLQQWHTIYAPTPFFFLNLWLTSQKPDRFTIHYYITQLDFFFEKKLEKWNNFKKEMTHFHAQCRSLSPFSCYPAWEITMASRPIVTHCHATILHFLWSILKSVQKEKYMKASSNTHTQKCTTHTPSLSIAYIQKDTSTQVKEQENKVTLKPNVKLFKTESKCLWLKGKN